jgi:hypothetical protein
MNFGVHIIKFPSGRYGFVGSIPTGLGDEVPASKSAVMGSRAYRNNAGEIVELKFPTFDSEAQARAYMKSRERVQIIETN